MVEHHDRQNMYYSLELSALSSGIETLCNAYGRFPASEIDV